LSGTTRFAFFPFRPAVSINHCMAAIPWALFHARTCSSSASSTTRARLTLCGSCAVRHLAIAPISDQSAFVAVMLRVFLRGSWGSVVIEMNGYKPTVAQ
jgi:hypothetical protein